MTQDELKAAWLDAANLKPDGISADEYLVNAVRICTERLKVYTEALPIMMCAARLRSKMPSDDDQVIAELLSFVSCTVHVHLAHKMGLDVDGIVAKARV